MCRSLKSDDATSEAFVVFVSTKSADVDRVVALELGADDYVAKPFSVREIVLRVGAVLRRISRGHATAQRRDRCRSIAPLTGSSSTGAT